MTSNKKGFERRQPFKARKFSSMAGIKLMRSSVLTREREGKLFSLVQPRPVRKLLGHSVQVSDDWGKQFTLRIDFVRDLMKDPIEVDELLDAPFQRFSRWQIYSVGIGTVYLGPEVDLDLMLFGQDGYRGNAGYQFGSSVEHRNLLVALIERLEASGWELRLIPVAFRKGARNA